MSNVAQIITKVRQRSQIRSSEMSDDDILLYLNDNYKKLWRKVTNIDKNFGYSMRSQTLVEGQSEYPLLYTSGGGQFGQMKIENVSIRLSATNNVYVRLEEKDRDRLQQDKTYYEQNYTSKPFYVLARNSLFVYPIAKKTISNGIRIDGVKRQIDLTLSTQESDIYIEADYHYILEIMTTIDIARIRQRYDLAQEHESKIYSDIETMLKEIKKRVTRPVQGIVPFLD